jgi:hypothetical protein
MAATKPLAVDSEQFAALCNLFHSLCCDRLDLTAGQAGDVLLYGANRVVCDESRLMARVVIAFLGLRFGGGDLSAADLAAVNAHLDEIARQMRAGEGSLTDPELEDLLEGGLT